MNKTKKLSRNHVWENYLQSLQIYVKKNESVIVPVNTRLGRWLLRQRMRWDQLSKLQQKKLNNINQDIKDLNEVHLWQKSFNELLDYKKSHGHINITSTDSKHKNLYRWIVAQRRKNEGYQKSDNKWTLRSRDEWENRRNRLIEAFNFSFKNQSTLNFEKKDMQDEIFRLIDQHAKKHGTGICADLEKWCLEQRKIELEKITQLVQKANHRESIEYEDLSLELEWLEDVEAYPPEDDDFRTDYEKAN